MNDAIALIRSEFRGSWRFRWPALLAAWVISLIGWVVVFTLPDSFESHASVYVNTESPLWESLKGIATPNSILTRVEIESKSLKSRPALEKLATAVDLHLRAKGPDQMDRLITSMATRVVIKNEPRRDPNLYRISFSDFDPIMAKLVVSELLNSFVEESLDASRQESQDMQIFYREQLSQLEVKLTESERALAEFKKKNVGRMPGESGGYFTRLQTEMLALENVDSNLKSAERRQITLRDQLSGEASMIDPLNSAQSEIDIRIEQNRTRLEELQLRFTDLHPDVIAVRAVLQQLEDRKRRDVEQLSTSGGAGIPSDNPVYQAIQIDLAAIGVEISSLEEERRSRSQKISELKALVDVLPEVEAELVRLNRDYDVKQTQYQALLVRLGSAELSESAEASQDARFRVIEPPLLPEIPNAPNRPLLMAAVLLAGLAAGGGLAFLGNLVAPVFNDSKSLRDATSIPVLGSVQVMRTEERRAWRKRQLVGFLTGILGLCLTFGILFLIRDKATNLVQTFL